MVENVVDRVPGEEVVDGGGVLPARPGVEGDPLGGRLEVAPQRDLLARLRRVVPQADVAGECLAEVDVPVKINHR